MKEELKNHIINTITAKPEQLEILTDEFSFLSKGSIKDILEWIDGEPIIKDNSGYRISLNKKEYYNLI
jgi:hypothetical protein